MAGKCFHVSVDGREVIECGADVSPPTGWSKAVGNDPADKPANAYESCVGGSAERVGSPGLPGVYDRFAENVKDYIAGRPCAGGDHAVIQGLIEVARSGSANWNSAADELYEIAKARPELAIECINGLEEAAGTNYAAAYQLRSLVSERPELASMIIQKLGHMAIWNNVLALQSLEQIAGSHPELVPDIEKELNFILGIVSQAPDEKNRYIGIEDIKSSLDYIGSLKNNSPAGAGGKETIW